MKKLLIVAAMTLLVIGLSPKFFGAKVADERARVIGQINEIEGITVTSKSYVANWFSAQSVAEVTLDLAQQGLGDITFIVDEKLSFGPILITADDWFLGLGHSEISFRSSGVAVDDEIMTFINEKVHLSTKLTFANKIVAYIRTDLVTFEDGENQFIAKPAVGQFSVSNTKDFIGELTWAGLELKNSEENIAIGTVTVDTKQSIVSGSYLQGTAILSGDAKFLVESINYEDVVTNELFALQKLLFTTSVSVKDDLLALALAYNAEEIITVGQTFKQPNLDVVLTGIDINALQEFNALLASLPQDSSAQGVSTDIANVLPALAGKFIAKGPRLKVTDLSLETSAGKIVSTFNVTIDKQLFDNKNLMSVMAALNADASGNAPAEFFTQFGVTPMINNFVEQGYLIKQDNTLSFVAKFSQAQLEINGKTIQN